MITRYHGLNVLESPKIFGHSNLLSTVLSPSTVDNFEKDPINIGIIWVWISVVEDNPELEVELSGAIAVNELGGRSVEFEVTWLEMEQVPVEDELSEDTIGEACWRDKRWHKIIQLSLDILFEIIIGL